MLRKTNVREVVNALFYIDPGLPVAAASKRVSAVLDCAGVVYSWSRDGTWVTINHALVVMARENEGRQASPIRRCHRQPIGEDDGKWRSERL